MTPTMTSTADFSLTTTKSAEYQPRQPENQRPDGPNALNKAAVKTQPTNPKLTNGDCVKLGLTGILAISAGIALTALTVGLFSPVIAGALIVVMGILVIGGAIAVSVSLAELLGNLINSIDNQPTPKPMEIELGAVNKPPEDIL